MNDPVNSIIGLIEQRGDVVGAFAANNVFTPALVKAIAQLKMGGKICSYGFDLGPAQQEGMVLKRGENVGERVISQTTEQDVLQVIVSGRPQNGAAERAGTDTLTSGKGDSHAR